MCEKFHDAKKKKFERWNQPDFLRDITSNLSVLSTENARG